MCIILVLIENKFIGNRSIVPRGFDYLNIKNWNFGVGLSHFKPRTAAVHSTFWQICVMNT